jgi:hypothetical protein
MPAVFADDFHMRFFIPIVLSWPLLISWNRTKSPTIPRVEQEATDVRVGREAIGAGDPDTGRV